MPDLMFTVELAPSCLEDPTTLFSDSSMPEQAASTPSVVVPRTHPTATKLSSLETQHSSFTTDSHRISIKPRLATDLFQSKKLPSFSTDTKRAVRRSIAYLPTPRASQGFHQHDLQRVFDEEFLEQLRLRRLRIEHEKGLRRHSLRSVVTGLHRRDESSIKVAGIAPATRYSLSRSMKKLRRRLSWTFSHLKKPIHPDGALNHLRQFVLFCVLVFQLFYLPFAPVYLSHTEQETFKSINVLMELVLLVDTLLGFNTAVYDITSKQMNLVIARGEIGRRYLTGRLLPNLLGSLPLECITLLLRPNGDTRALIFVNKGIYIVGNVLRFLRVRQLPYLTRCAWVRAIIDPVSRISKLWCGDCHSILSAVTKLHVKVFIAAHYFACVLRCVLNTSSAGRASSSSEHHSNLGPSTAVAVLYTRDLLQIVSTLLGNGREIGDTAADAYSVFLVFVGILLSAYITSRVALEVLTNLRLVDENHGHFKDSSPQKSASNSTWNSEKFFSVGSVEKFQPRLRRRKSKTSTTQRGYLSCTTDSADSEAATQISASSLSADFKWRSEAESALDSSSGCDESGNILTRERIKTTAAASNSGLSQLVSEFSKTVRRMEAKLNKVAIADGVRKHCATRKKLHHSKSAPGSTMMLPPLPEVNLAPKCKYQRRLRGKRPSNAEPRTCRSDTAFNR